MKDNRQKVNKQLDKVIAADKLYKNYYSKQGGLLSKFGAEVKRENERKLKKLVR